MKRLFITSVLCLTLMASKPVLAGDKIGVYVAPKFFISQQNSDSFEERDNTGFGGALRTARGLKSDKSDTVLGGGLALGYDFRPTFSLPIRTELEYAAHVQARFSRSGRTGPGAGYAMTTTRKAEVSTLFANAFFDIDTGTKFTPYVGGGVGVAHIRVKDSFWNSYSRDSGSSKTVDNFAWNLGAGVAYSFDNNWSADLGFRYNNFGKANGSTARDRIGAYEHVNKDKASSEEVLLGLRYAF